MVKRSNSELRKATPAMMPSHARKEVVQDLRSKREDNIARSTFATRPLTQRIGNLFPELKQL